MFELAGKNDSPYFQIRLKNLKKQLETFVKNKGYEKQEFDRIYHQLGKMKQNDSVEFLDESLRNRLERIAQKHYSPGDMISSEVVATSKKGKYYITFRCGTIYFITDWSSYTVLKDLDRRKIPWNIRVRFIEYFQVHSFTDFLKKNIEMKTF